MASDGGAGDVDEGWRSRGRSLPNSTPMATPLQMFTSYPLVDPDRSGYGSSAGGKLRAIRRGARRNPNPYERPAVGRHASAGPQAAVLISNGGVTAAQALAERRRGAWLATGITKIITSSATYLYSSIFRRRLPAPLQVSDIDTQQGGAEEQVSSPSAEANEVEAVSRFEGEDDEQVELQELANNNQSDIERLLRQKTLSGEEYERLSTLLRSRVMSNGLEKNKQVTQEERGEVRVGFQESHPAAGVQTEAQRWRQDLQNSREERENGARTLSVYENGTPSTPTPAAAVESLDGLSSSPVDVAIAFMGRRVTSQPGTNSPAEPLNRRDENVLSTGPSSLLVSQATLAKWAPPDFGDEEQFRTPAPPAAQIRSRNQGFSRTPYSRPQRLQPSRERAIDGTFGTPLASRWTPIRTPVTGGREMLKRRSTVLEDSYASVGPIRRTRHKAFGTPAPSSIRSSGFPLASTTGSANMTIPLPQVSKFGGVSAYQRNAGGSNAQDKTTLGASTASYVPAQSSETARKILETLEKMTPSPKGKSLEDELSFVRERPPTPLTESMLNDQARKSMSVIDYTLPGGDSREPGPSGRTLIYDSPSIGPYGSGLKFSEFSPKLKGKGKSSLSPENGPHSLQSAQERKLTGAGLIEEVSNRTKETEAVLASKNDKGKGFRMSAVFEESGSDDEGRLTSAAAGTSPLVSTIPSLPGFSTKTASSTISTSTKTLTIAAPSFTTNILSSTSTETTTNLAGTSASTSAVEASKTAPAAQMTPGFTFPTRVSLEGPPTPKAMSPASTSPKAVPTTTPFSPFAASSQAPAAQVAASSRTEHASAPAKVDSPIESKSEFTFGSSANTGAAFPQGFQNPPANTEAKVSNLFSQRTPLFGASSASAIPSTLSTATSAGAATSVLAPPTSIGSSLKSDSSAPVSGSGLALKDGSTASPFGPSASNFLFGSGTGTASKSSGAGASASFTAGSASFGLSNQSPFGSASTTPSVQVATDAQAVVSKSNGTPSLDNERPQKRSSTAFEQDSSKRQPSMATASSHSFTTFGTNVVSSAPASPIPVTFGASSSSQSLFSTSSFGQLPRESQSSSTLMSNTAAPSPAPFLFGTPSSTAAAATPPSSAAEFSTTPSFPSFPGSVFGTSSSGSTFGATGATPMTFGGASSTPAFGSTAAKPAFGSFTSEAVSQSPSPSVPAFGSGFPSPSPTPAATPAFAFGGSSSPAAFSFSASGTSAASMSTFAFGSSPSFPFPSNKSTSSTPAPSIFGLSGSVTAFGATTNGSMASDVVVNDHSNMEDSMAEEPPQVGAGMPAQQVSPFGGPSAPGASAFVFGAQTGAPTVAAPSLFGFPTLPNAGGFAANPFAAAAAAAQPAAGSLNFAGGSFTLGSSGVGDNRPTRKFIKAKRTSAKRGK